jgi:hypothetical protein
MDKIMDLPDKIKEMFRKEGSIGGKISSANLTKEERKRRGTNAINARWAKIKKSKVISPSE